MNLTNPPLTRGLGLTRSFDRRGKVPGTPSTLGLAQTVSIDTRVKPELAQIIKEIGVRSVTHGELGEVTASSLIRFAATTTASGADASIAIQVRASVGAAFEDAGIYLDANVSGLGGASRIRIEADNVVISDGSDVDPVFEFVGGQLYLRNVVLVTAIDDDVVTTENIQANAVTQLVAAEDGTPGSPVAIEATITRTAGTSLLILAFVNLTDQDDSLATPVASQTIEVNRGATNLYSDLHYGFVTGWAENAGGNTTSVRWAGAFTLQLIDDDNVSGSQTYEVDIGAAAFSGDFASISLIEFKR